MGDSSVDYGSDDTLFSYLLVRVRSRSGPQRNATVGVRRNPPLNLKENLLKENTSLSGEQANNRRFSASGGGSGSAPSFAAPQPFLSFTTFPVSPSSYSSINGRDDLEAPLLQPPNEITISILEWKCKREKKNGKMEINGRSGLNEPLLQPPDDVKITVVEQKYEIEKKVKTIKFTIGNIKCASYSMSIESMLGELDGVERVIILPLDGCAAISYILDLIKDKKIKNQ